MNAFLKWQGSSVKIPKLKEERKVLTTLTPEPIRRVVSFRPKGINQMRT